MKKLLVIVFGLSVLLHAGITDFKTIEAANKAYEAKEYGQSAALLEGIKKSNDTSELHYNLGNTYYKKGHYEKAIEEYNTAEGVDEALRQYNLGNSYFKNGDFNKSVESFQESLKYKDDPDTRNNLKAAKEALKKKKEKLKKDKDSNKKGQDDKKQNKDKKKKDDKKKQDGKEKDDKKKSDKEQEGQKDKNDSKKEKKPTNKKGDKEGSPSTEKKKSKEEKLNEQELKRLMKKMQKGKTPTMMYQMGEGNKGKNTNAGRSEDAKPW